MLDRVVMRPVGDTLAALSDLVLPRHCVACRRPDRWGWCPRCRPAAEPFVSDSLGVSLAAAGAYDGAVRTALLAYKERGRRDLARALGEVLASSVRALDGTAGAVLVPVPSSRRARRERGGDHLLRLARIAASSTGHRTADPLRLTRAVRDSAGLDTAARSANLAGAMAAREPRAARTAVVVDDIATTGATITEATRALRAAGWRVAGVAVIAATVKHAGPDRWRDASHGSSVGAT